MNTRQIFSVGIVSLLIVGLAPPQAGCKSLTPEAKQNIVDGTKLACGLANAFLNDSDLAALCNFAKDEIGPIMNLVSMQRVAVAKGHAAGVTEGAARVGSCGPSPNMTNMTDAGSLDAAVTPPALKDAGSTSTTDGAVRPVAPKAR